ncbi:branched-chain amino acid ABC transporter substrate-binding protein [Methylobacterium sp. E-016]|uniref:branched-chain amino acid ABC transporter substrate-binding protein n=1 Tax=Methylobacterium sp. E-016 TaxID=2836556 RepID=UPI001FBA9932|nr:branched-chain amino acid ABC transporter substrate-binding protein [Methylobacterium sp. E-016]MCJ2079328.1 branched-chain amino acid ABC transporter substrate-binding protein [Methylobacterium sp. E-016]
MRALIGIVTALLLAAPAAAQTVTKIGLSAPLTGPDAAFGQGMRLGAEQAVADLNRAAGASGRKLALVVADDAGDAKQGVAVARRFAADGIRLVVGPLESSVAAATAAIYDDAGIVVVTPGASWAALTRRGHATLFRIVAGDAQQGEAAGRYLLAHEAGRRVAIVHDRTTFGRGLADAVSATLKAAGRPEVAFESLPRGSRDAADLAATLKAARVDAVYFGGLAPEASTLAHAMRDAGSTARLVASDGILDRDFATLASSAGEGTVMTVPAEPARLPEVKGRPPRTAEADALAGLTYAAVEVLAQAVDRAKSRDGRTVAAALRGAPFRTIQGEIAFDAQGDPSSGAVALKVWKRAPDGRLDYAGNETAP